MNGSCNTRSRQKRHQWIAKSPGNGVAPVAPQHQMTEQSCERKDAHEKEDQRKHEDAKWLPGSDRGEKVRKRRHKQIIENKPAFADCSPVAQVRSQVSAGGTQDMPFFFQRKKEKGRSDIENDMTTRDHVTPPKGFWGSQMTKRYHHASNGGSNIGAQHHRNRCFQTDDVGRHHRHKTGRNGGRTLNNGGG